MAYGLWLDGIDHVELGSEPLSASKHSHSAPLCVVEEDRSHDTYSVQFTLLSVFTGIDIDIDTDAAYKSRD